MTPAVVGILSLVGVVFVVCVLLAFGKAMEARVEADGRDDEPD